MGEGNAFRNAGSLGGSLGGGAHLIFSLEFSPMTILSCSESELLLKFF